MSPAGRFLISKLPSADETAPYGLGRTSTQPFIQGWMLQVTCAGIASSALNVTFESAPAAIRLLEGGFLIVAMLLL